LECEKKHEKIKKIKKNKNPNDLTRLTPSFYISELTGARLGLERGLDIKPLT
jgi:hypothetical protein